MIQVVVASVCQRSPATRCTSLCKRDAPSCAVAFLILCRPEDSSWEMSMYEGRCIHCICGTDTRFFQAFTFDLDVLDSRSVHACTSFTVTVLPAFLIPVRRP